MIIYKATNKITNTVYVGKTIRTLEKRISDHLYCSKEKSFTYFHRALKKYGKDNFEWEILCESPVKEKSYLNSLERFYIAAYKVINNGNIYNLTSGGDGVVNPSKETIEKMKKAWETRIISEETRTKMSVSRKGSIVSDVTKEKLRISNTGKKHSEETKNKLRGNTNSLGVIKSEETRKKLSISLKNSIYNKGENHYNFGKNLSEETKNKIGLSNRGKKRSEEFKTYMKEKCKGRVLSEETKNKIKKSMTGRIVSDETRLKMSLSAKNRKK